MGFRLNIRNRRLKVDKEIAGDKFEPVFKATLWKVKADGDRMIDDHWFEREMWIAKNGSLVYWSKKEDRELVYYTADDIARASLAELAAAQSLRPWSFQVKLPAANDVEFAPGEFAAESEDMRKTWIAEFKKFQKKATVAKAEKDTQ